MSTRIVICVDLVPDHPELAYCDLFKAMAKSGLDWESSSEWYKADGTPLTRDEAQDARMAGFARMKL